MLRFIDLSEALRFWWLSTVRKMRGPRKYAGRADEICRQIIDACWNGRYFRNSAGHYQEFWSRDFGWCVDALLDLGEKKRCLATVEYALGIFARHGHITTTISPSGKPFSFPDLYSPDSVAYLFHAVRTVNSKKLVTKYRTFLENELARFAREAIDPKTGMIRRDKQFSGMRDYALRESSCYDTTMAAWLSAEADKLDLKNPLSKYNFPEKLKTHFWNGIYFHDDLSQTSEFTADANLFPFWTGVIKDRRMLTSVLREFAKRALDTPFPLKYTVERKSRMRPIELLVPDWEQDCIWTHMGPLYLSLIRTIKPRECRLHLVSYAHMIEKHRTYFELFSPTGKPYRSFFYMADESMLWAANLLVLLRTKPK